VALAPIHEPDDFARRAALEYPSRSGLTMRFGVQSTTSPGRLTTCFGQADVAARNL
jgi:hypothetical protein